MPKEAAAMVIRISVFVLTLVATPMAVFAQNSRADGVAARIGYQALHIPDETFPFGLNFDFAAPVTSRMHLVGEFGFAKDEQTESGVSGNLTLYNLGGGARWTPLRNVPAARGTLVPFAQVLIGALRTDADLALNGESFNDADWAFMIQPGGGVTIPLSPALGVVGQVDYRRAFFSTAENEFRFVIGVQIQRR